MSLVITGNPGVGKHTIAKNFCKLFDYKILDINEIAIKADLFEKKRETLDVDIIKLKKLIKTKITSKTLVVGHLAPYVLTKSQVKTAIILRKSPYKLVTVYKKRGYSREKTLENLGSEILGIVTHDTIKKFGKRKTFQINATGESNSRILKKIESAIYGKLESERVDWLRIITEKDDFKKFFMY